MPDSEFEKFMAAKELILHCHKSSLFQFKSLITLKAHNLTPAWTVFQHSHHWTSPLRMLVDQNTALDSFKCYGFILHTVRTYTNNLKEHQQL